MLVQNRERVGFNCWLEKTRYYRDSSGEEDESSSDLINSTYRSLLSWGWNGASYQFISEEGDCVKAFIKFELITELY